MRGSLPQRMLSNEGVDDRPAADEMLLNNPLEDRRIAFAVPGTIGIDNGNRSAFADAQAVGFRSHDAALLRQPQLLQAGFQKLPGGEAAILVAALGFGLVAAEKHVPLRDRHADALRDRALRFNGHLAGPESLVP